MTVEQISRVGFDRVRSRGRENVPFLLRIRAADGARSELIVRAIVDASGTWPTPNVLGANGLAAHGEAEAAKYITASLPDVVGTDRDRFAGRQTVVVGAGHSATTTLLALAELALEAPDTTVTWAIRAGTRHALMVAGMPTRCRLEARSAPGCAS